MLIIIIHIFRNILKRCVIHRVGQFRMYCHVFITISIPIPIRTKLHENSLEAFLSLKPEKQKDYV